MTYNEFRLRFAIQYVGCVSDPGESMLRMDNAPALARLLWDVMNAPEVKAPAAPITTELSKNMANLPKDMANSPDLKPSNSTELKSLARTARDLFSDEAQWLAVDSDGEVWAFDLEPTIDELLNFWYNDGTHWEIGAVAPPADFTKEIYEIDKLLENDNE